MSSIEHLAARLQEQKVEVSNLRTALDIQLNRISLVCELDVLPRALRRRQLIDEPLGQTPS